jgi:hypothetical protein
MLLFQRFDLVDPSIHARRMLTDLKQGERSALDHIRTFEYWCSHVVDQSEGEKVHMFLHSLNPRSQRACSVNPLTQRQWDNFAEASRCFLSNAMAASPSAALTEMAPFEPVAAPPSGTQGGAQRQRNAPWTVVQQRGNGNNKRGQQGGSYAAAAAKQPRGGGAASPSASRPAPRQLVGGGRGGRTGAGNSNGTQLEYRNAVGQPFVRSGTVRNVCFRKGAERCLCCFAVGHHYGECKSRPQPDGAVPS